MALAVLVVFTALRIDLIYNGLETRLKNSNKRASACNGVFIDVCTTDGRTSLKANVKESKYLVDDKFIRKNGDNIADVRILDKKGRLVLEQLNEVYATSLWGCELVNIGKQCGFCASRPYQGPNFSIEDLTEEIEKYDVKSLTLNAGTVLTPDKGYNKMSEYIISLKKSGVKELNLELMPPDEPRKVFLKAAEDGVTSIQLNLEIWSKNLRRYIMPYKGEISRKIYLEATEIAVEVFGAGKVSSVLMAGLDTVDALYKGADAVFDSGGVPSIEVFRALPGTRLENWRFLPEIDKIIELDKYVKERISSFYAVDSLEGCLKCLGCNVGGPK